jgi:hypothetical protein
VAVAELILAIAAAAVVVLVVLIQQQSRQQLEQRIPVRVAAVEVIL